MQLGPKRQLGDAGTDRACDTAGSLPGTPDDDAALQAILRHAPRLGRPVDRVDHLGWF